MSDNYSNNQQAHSSCSYSRKNVRYGEKAKISKNTHYNSNKKDATYFDVNASDARQNTGKYGSKIKQSEVDSDIKVGNKESNRFETSFKFKGPKDTQAKPKRKDDSLSSFRYSGDNYNNRKPGNERQKDEYCKSTHKGINDSNSMSSKPAEDMFTNWNDFLLSMPPAEVDWDQINKEFEEEKKLKFSKCPPLTKDFYEEHHDVKAMSEAEVKHFMKTHNISVSHIFSCKTEKIPNPVFTFQQAFHSFPEILDDIKKHKFEKPTPIQSQAWPILLNGKNLIGIAQTGTGKTLAFLLPALIHIDNQPVPRSERGGPNVIVLAPTRELVQQIEKEVKKYHYKNIKCVSVYGGGNRDEQIKAINKGVQIVIATPGRLNDIISDGVLKLSSVTYLVLDEADRMLDMGFEPQIRDIVVEIRPDRQTVMTSATWPEGVRELAKSYMDNPVQVHVGSLNLAAVHTVTQIVEILQESEKNHRLMEFCLKMGEDDKVIVFIGKKAKVDDLCHSLRDSSVKCSSMHGDREQWERDKALHDFKAGQTQILLATDVASRGIDINDITHILNYDFPRNMEEYVHRIGRTGRAGRTGQAISFFTKQDMRHAKELISILKEANQMIPEELHRMASEYDIMKQETYQDSSDYKNYYNSRRGYK